MATLDVLWSQTRVCIDEHRVLINQALFCQVRYSARPSRLGEDCGEPAVSFLLSGANLSLV